MKILPIIYLTVATLFAIGAWVTNKIGDMPLETLALFSTAAVMFSFWLGFLYAFRQVTGNKGFEKEADKYFLTKPTSKALSKTQS